MSRLQYIFIAVALLLPAPPMAGQDATDHAPPGPEQAAQEPAVPSLDPARGLAIIRSLDRLRRDNPSTWQALDRNGDGGLCAEELRPIAGAQAPALVAMFDSDNNQRLDPYEVAFYAAEATRSVEARNALGDHDTLAGPTPDAGPVAVRPRPTDAGGRVVVAQSVPWPYRLPGAAIVTHNAATVYSHDSTRAYFGYACPLAVHYVRWSRPAPPVIWQRRAIVGPGAGLVPGTGPARAGVSTLHVIPRRP